VALDPERPYAASWEEEADGAGALAPTAVILLTNRECPFTCVMCDLWTHTLDTAVPPGSVPRQIAHALDSLPPARQVKLYNAGSFFDPQAIPPGDDAAMLAPFDRVIVEAHPAFLTGVHGARCLRFRDRLRGRLEVAIGLETAHPDALARLNKRMTLEHFHAAAAFLSSHDIDLRAFLLLNPPFVERADAVDWTCRSLDVARDAGAVAASVIPTRGGNGAMEALGAAPWSSLKDLEAAVEYGLSAGGMRVFADLWDIERLSACACAPSRVARLRRMNATQRVDAAVECVAC
jgi:radical SAM enzyme (TIGR01210 family)